MGKADKNLCNNGGVNLYARMVDDAEGLEKIENLQSHDNTEISEKAVKVLKTNWLDEDDGTLFPGDGSQSGFQGAEFNVPEFNAHEFNLIYQRAIIDPRPLTSLQSEPFNSSNLGPPQLDFPVAIQGQPEMCLAFSHSPNSTLYTDDSERFPSTTNFTTTSIPFPEY